MNKKLNTREALLLLALPLAFGATWLLSGCKGSETEKDTARQNGAGKPGQPSNTPIEEKGPSQAPASSFADAAVIWKEVASRSADLDRTIADKDMEGVHHHAFSVRDQVNLLPAKSQAFSTDDLAKLDQGVKTVASLAAELDEAGDSNKQTEAEALNRKLHTVLDAIKALYPEGALK